MRPVRTAVAVLALAAVAACALRRSAPPRPRGEDAPPAEFSAARAEETLRRLLAEETPRPPGSPEHQRFRQRLEAELGHLSLVPRVERGFACSPRGSCAYLANLLAELPGSARGPAVLLVAHYDSVEAGPGASDDAAGVACVLETARALLTAPRRNPVLLLFTDGEEAGLLGAELFARSEQARAVGAVVNLEARGTSGASFMFETSRDNAWLVRRAVARLPRPVTSSVFSFVYDRLPNDTDLSVFKRAGLPGLNLAFIGSAARYHTPQDSLANLSRAALQHQGDNALALARALAGVDLASPPPGRAVFFDLAGLVVLWWPRGLSPVLALLALTLVRVAAARRGGRLVPRGRVVLPFLAPLLGAVAAGAVWQALRLARAWPVTFVAHPGPAVVAAAAAALAVVLPALVLESRWTGSPADAWERFWTSTALVGLALALAAPELSHLAVVPALAAGLARLLLPEAVAVWTPFALLGLVLLALALRLPEALGPVGLPVVGLAAGLVLASVPLPATRGATGRVAAALVGVGAVAMIAAIALPAVTPDSPEHGSILLVEGEGEGAATLVIRPESGRLPGALAAAARFEGRARALPWARPSAAFGAAHPSPGLPFPGVEVLEERRRPDGERHVTLRIASARGAGTVGLALVEGPGASVTRVEGQPLPSGHGSGPGLVVCRGTPPGGVVVELSLAGEPRGAFVFDWSPGLPESALEVRGSRPATVAPADGGDATVLYRRTSL